MAAKLGGSLGRKEGLFWWSFDPMRDGWQKFTKSGKRRLRQEILHMKERITKVKTRKGRFAS